VPSDRWSCWPTPTTIAASVSTLFIALSLSRSSHLEDGTAVRIA
jgi:hypothetical protein